MAVNKLSIDDLPIDNILVVPPPEYTSNKEYIIPPQADLTFTPDPIRAKAHKQVVGVDNTGGNVYGNVSKGSSVGPGRFYRSEQQQPYPIKNEPFFKQTITLRPQILIRQFSDCYVKYSAEHGESFCSLIFDILNCSKR